MEGGIPWPLIVPAELEKNEWFQTLSLREREAPCTVKLSSSYFNFFFVFLRLRLKVESITNHESWIMNLKMTFVTV